MGIYIFTLFLVLFMWIIFNRITFTLGKHDINRNLHQYSSYVMCMGIWLFFVAAFRNYTVGADTYVYMRRYTIFAALKWNELFKMADRYMFEYGYAIINKLLGYINKNPRFLLWMVALFVIFIFSYYIYRESKIPWLSFYMFITLGMFGESLCLWRQYIAVAFVLLAYDAIKNNKLFIFVTMILLASTFHTSALVVLPMFWISKIKFNKLYVCLILGFSVVVFGIFMSPTFRLSESIIHFLAQHTTYVRYLNRLNTGSGALGFTLIYFSFLFLIIIKLNNSDIEERNMYIAFAMASAVLTLTTFITGISERMLPYFASMFIVSIPEVIMSEAKRKIRMQYVLAICIVLMIYYLGIICRADAYQLIPYQLWDNRARIF